MPILPHPTEDNTWIIAYVVLEDGHRKFKKVEFVGPLKDALKNERELRQSAGYNQHP